MNLPNVMTDLILQLNFYAEKSKIDLETTEASSDVARAQGFIAGVVKYKEVLEDSGYSLDPMLFNTKNNKVPYWEEAAERITLVELYRLVNDLDTFLNSDDYNRIKQNWEEAVSKQKDKLFYEGEKGRELYYCKGWYFAMSRVGKIVNWLKDELKHQEKEKSESLPFGEF